MLVCDAQNRPLHANRALLALFEAEPGGEALRVAVEEIARTLATNWGTAGDAAAPLPAPTARRVATGHGTYHLYGSYVPVETLAAEPAVVVVVEPATEYLPTPGALREQYGLTPREAEIALLLAHGLSANRIAAQLRISVHTVRRHTEHTMAKLGVRSRAQVRPTLERAVSNGVEVNDG